MTGFVVKVRGCDGVIEKVVFLLMTVLVEMIEWHEGRFGK